MSQLQSSSAIITEPFPPGLCRSIVSDKHWLGENILCLLVNAVKYGNGGLIRVAVNVMATPFAKETPSMTSQPSANAAKFSPPAVQKLIASARDENGASSKDGERSRSRKVSRSRSRMLRQSVQANAGALMLRISVEDNGLGFTAEERINFYDDVRVTRQGRTRQECDDPNKSKVGKSLGLYILKKRVQVLGGSCGVDIRTDGQTGSIYWFTIPYKPGMSAGETGTAGTTTPVLTQVAEEAVLEVHEDDEESLNVGPLSILIVDDSLTTLKVLRRTLMEIGHRVDTAKDGKQALDAMTAMLQSHVDWQRKTEEKISDSPPCCTPLISVGEALRASYRESTQGSSTHDITVDTTRENSPDTSRDCRRESLTVGAGLFSKPFTQYESAGPIPCFDVVLMDLDMPVMGTY
jgi:CheY-like chemotaxis protein